MGAAVAMRATTPPVGRLLVLTAVTLRVLLPALGPEAVALDPYHTHVVAGGTADERAAALAHHHHHHDHRQRHGPRRAA